MPNPRFIIRVDFANVRAEVWVNGIPVGLVEPKDHSPVAIPVNEFLLDGQNTVGVLLHAGPVPSRAAEPWHNDERAAAYTGEAALSLSIARYEEEQTALGDNPPPLTTLPWQGRAEPQPSYIERKFNLAAGLGRWAWETATQFTVIDPALRAEALAYLSYLWMLLAARRFEDFLEESAIKLNELTSGAYGIAPEPMRRDMLQALQTYSTPPSSLEPRNPDDVDLRLVAGGRMIECLRRDRGYVLQFRTPGEDDLFFLPTMIGKKGDRWRILR